MALITASGLCVSLAVPAQASPVAAARPVTAAAAPAPVVAKDDLVSARIAAKTQKHPVEVVGSRTESSTTWALPNGQLRTDSNPAPVRVERADGSWAGIDLTLVAGKDGWSPKVSPRPVTFSAGGDGAVATFKHDGRTVRMGWSGTLPAPTISGASATYAVSATEDLVVEAKAGGFEQSLVIKSRSSAGEATTVTLPLTLDGVKAEVTKRADGKVAGDGGAVALTAVKASGKGEDRVAVGDAVFAIQDPVMFSAARDAKSGEHTQVKGLTAKLQTAPTSGPAVGADAAVVLKADQTFLDDPKTVYPVTIDPTIVAVDAYGDTWIQDGDGTAHWGDSQLYTGMYSGKLTGALVGFLDDQYAGNHVTSATLGLYNTFSGSCTASDLSVFPVTDPWDETTTWASGPDFRTDYSGTGTFAHGFSGTCPAAAESIDVTDIVAAWSWSDINRYGFLLAASDSDTSERKAFCSMDLGAAPCDQASRVPTLSVTYNSYPWDPREVTASPEVAGSNGITYVTSLTPNLQAKIGNTDGANVSVQGEISYDEDFPADGSGEFWFGEGSAATPNSLASVRVDTPLTTGKHYRYRVRGAVIDGSGGTDIGPWSDYTYFTVDSNPPVAPTIACTTYVANAWTDSSASSTCTLDTTSAGGSGYWWGLDNPSPEIFLNDSTNSGAPLTVSINPGEGRHVLYARSRDVALNTSSTTTAYTFGVGNGGVLTPVANDTTQKAVGLTAQSSSARTQVTYSYRPGTDTSLSWTTVPPANVTPAGSTTAITAWPQTGTVSGGSTNYPQLNWNAAATIAGAGGTNGVIQVRACFTQAGGNQWCSAGTTFILAKTDFASSAAISMIGPGGVSLSTGSFNVTEADVSVGGLTVGRTHTSLVPSVASTGPEGVFGPGWWIGAFGPDAGAGVLTLTDSSISGYVTVKDSAGTETTFIKNGSVFTGTGDGSDGSKLIKSSSIVNPLDNTDATNYAGWQLTDSSGTVTTFLPQSTGSATYLSKWIDAVGKETESAFVRDTSGRVTKIVAPAPAGITCATMVAGCQALNVIYASGTTASGTAEANWGDYDKQVKAITFTNYDPSSSTMVTTTVASYLYDSTGHLRARWDPRISPALKTRYTYDSAGRLSTDTPPGLATWTMTYDSAGRLADVARTDPTNGLAKQSVVYSIPVSGAGAPVDLSLTQTATWNQTTDLPYSGAAVFPASRVPVTGTVSGVSGVHVPSAADWPYAQLTYTDVSGRVVNNAVFGAGTWQIDSVRYDANNNTVWQLSAGNRARALNPTGSTDPYVASQSSSAARADLLATLSIYSGDGVELRSTRGPAHQLHLASGRWASVRVMTAITYDEGAPGNDTYHLVTTSAVSSVPLDGIPTTAEDTRKTLTGYEPIDGGSSTGDTSGWILRAPTSKTTVMGTSPGSSDIVRKVRYDNAGRAVETRMPESTGSDAGTLITTYYTADTSAAVSACQSKPAWAGFLCRQAPAAQPSGKTIPSTLLTYSRWGDTATSVQISGASTRTTTNTYDGAGRVTTAMIAVVPAADGGTALPATTIGYDPSTGAGATATTSGGTVSTVFNTLGQQSSYTDADGNVSSTTYTVDGQPATRSDGKGTYTYSYDGTDAAGQIEHRGLLTALNVGMGAMPATFTAAYDSDGKLTKEVYPNGIIAARSYDDVGVTRSLHYSNRGYDWMSYDQGFDRDDHAVWSTGPIGETDYGYDNNNRLTKVQDRVLGECTTRSYTFSKNGNRTALVTSQPANDGSCQTSTTTAASNTYDAADRATTNGYEYDNFGRTTVTPGTQVTGGSDLIAGYYSNDTVASLSEGVRKKVFTLDPARRIRQTTDTTSNTETKRILNHYSVNNDSPTWIATSIDSGSTWTWQRNVTGIDGGLGAVQSSTGSVQIQLTNMHGDVVATVDDDVNATSTNDYFEQTEYGTPRSENPSNPERYGWLGSEQRSADALGGVTLMGARLYNSTTGRFLSVDPIPSGNENSYIYPNNPIGDSDVSGECNFFCRRLAGIADNLIASVGKALSSFFCTASGPLAVACMAVMWGVADAAGFLVGQLIRGVAIVWRSVGANFLEGAGTGLLSGGVWTALPPKARDTVRNAAVKALKWVAGFAASHGKVIAGGAFAAFQTTILALIPTKK